MNTRRTFKAAIALAVVTAVVGIGLQSASAASVSGTITSYTTPVSLTFDNHAPAEAALITLTTAAPDSDQLLTYCIDLNTHTNTGVTYDEGTWSEASVPGVANVTAILQASYPVLTVAQLQASSGIASLTEQEAIAGTQASIWHFTDLINLDRNDPLQNPTSNIGMLYDYLLRIASNPATEPVPALSITPSTISGTVATRVGPFTLHVTPTSATASVTNDAGVGFTDGNGAAFVPTKDGDNFWVTPTGAGSFHVNATAEIAVPTGRVFLHTATPTQPDAHQKLVLAKSTAVTTTAAASFQSTPAETTTTVAETTTTVAETTTTAAATTTTAAATTTTAATSEATEPTTAQPIVAALPPVPPSTFVAPAVAGVVALPVTGSSSTVPTLLMAAGTLLLGIAITAITRRRVPS